MDPYFTFYTMLKLLVFVLWYCEAKTAALAGSLGFHPDSSAVFLKNALHQS